MGDEDDLIVDTRRVDVANNGRHLVVNSDRGQVGGVGPASGKVNGEGAPGQQRHQPVPEATGRPAAVNEHVRHGRTMSRLDLDERGSLPRCGVEASPGYLVRAPSHLTSTSFMLEPIRGDSSESSRTS